MSQTKVQTTINAFKLPASLSLETSKASGKLLKALVLSISVALAYSSPHISQARETDLNYQHGVNALRAGDVKQAADYFKRAKQEGVMSSSLDYNLGVTLYKMGDYSKAKSAFTDAESGSAKKALVHYNLGLVEYRLGNKYQAKEWFTKVALNSKDASLNAMAEEAIKRIDGANPSKIENKDKPWAVMADLFMGYDDNLSLANTELAQGSNLSDSYYDVYAAAKYQLSGNSKNGYWVKGGISASRYDQYDTYDYTQEFIDLFRDAKYGNYQTRMGFKYSQNALGGKDYLQKTALRFQSSYPFGSAHKLTARYELAQYDEQAVAYSYLAGTRHRIRLDSYWRLTDKRIKLGYELESNDRDDFISGANFTSYSTTRHKLFADVTLMLSPQWKARVGIDYRATEYNDANVVAGTSLPIREEDRLRLKLAARYQLAGGIDLVAEYRFTDNDSNVGSERYQRNQYRLGVQGYF